MSYTPRNPDKDIGLGGGGVTGCRGARRKVARAKWQYLRHAKEWIEWTR